MIEEYHYRISKPIGERFLNLSLFDFVYVVTFSLSRRRLIYEFIKFAMNDTEYRGIVDLCFVVEVIHVKFNYDQLPTFIAVFEFTPKGQNLLNFFRKIGICEILKIEPRFIKSLFILLSSISFREYKMFETLKLRPSFSKATISNPFAQAILQRNVMKISNFEQTVYFQSNNYEEYIRKRQYVKNKRRQAAQDELQVQFYGRCFRHFQIHLNEYDTAFLKKMARKRGKDCDDMVNEDENYKRKEINVDPLQRLISNFEEFGLNESRPSRSRSRSKGSSSSSSSSSSHSFQFSPSNESLTNREQETKTDHHSQFAYRV